MLENFSIAADRIKGAKGIAEELGIPERQARHKLALGLIPHTREGALYIASRRRLRQWWESVTSGEQRPSTVPQRVGAYKQ